MKKFKWWICKHFGKIVIGEDETEDILCRVWSRQMFGLMYVYESEYYRKNEDGIWKCMGLTNEKS